MCSEGDIDILCIKDECKKLQTLYSAIVLGFAVTTNGITFLVKGPKGDSVYEKTTR